MRFKAQMLVHLDVLGIIYDVTKYYATGEEAIRKKRPQ